MVTIIGWSVAILGQLGVFYLLFRFLITTRRKGVWYGVMFLPLLLTLWFGYELFLGDNLKLIPSILAALVSALSAGLLWVLLPETKEAFTRYDQIRSEKEEVQSILDQLPVFVVLKSLGGTYQKVNSAFAQMLGKAIEILVGRSDADFFPPKIAQLFAEEQQRTIESKRVVTRRVELLTTRGKRWYEITFSTIVDKLGMTRSVLVCGQDITEVVDRTQSLETNLNLSQVLNHMTRKLLTCESETELWDFLLEFMEKIASTPYVTLALIAKDRDSLIIEKSHMADVIQVGTSIHSPSGLFGRVVQSSQMQWSERDAEWGNLLSGEEGKELGWAVGIPICLESKVVGVVGLFYKQSETELIEQRKDVLVEGAKIAGLVLKDMRYHRELAQRIACTQRDLEQSVLRQRIEHFLTALATRLVSAAPQQIDSLLEKAIGSFAEYVGAEKSYVYFFKKGDGGLQAYYRWATSGKLLPPTEILEPFDSLVSWILEKVNRQEIVVLSRSSEIPEGVQVYFDAQEIDFLVAIPMVLRRTVVGYFGLEGRQDTEGVIFDQTASVKAMADLIVNAIDRKWAAEELEERMRLVGEKITQLEIHNQRSKLLTEMGDLLQSCRTADEAFPIVARYSQMLMPNSTGSLYLLRILQDVAEKVAEWGNESSGENELVLSECWGIRRGRVHVARNVEGPLCDHLGIPIPETGMSVYL
ncbi:MAG: PAS domain-containing protein [Anaerolineales bacterium]|nr:PAS domain-containing protein [Anaerolineales bacterium]